MQVEIDQVCTSLDKLTLDALKQMEQHIQLKLNIENSMSDGESYLAKSRYVMGHKNVSALQLPTENSPEFAATAIVNENNDETLLQEKVYELEIRRHADETSNFHLQNPLNWFGLLVPQNLHSAQAKFRQALLWCIESVNTQAQLQEMCTKIIQLKTYKSKISTV